MTAPQRQAQRLANTRAPHSDDYPARHLAPHCARCRRPMIPQRATVPTPPGWARLAAKGLCTTHYSLSRRRTVRSAGAYRHGQGAWGQLADIDEIAVERACRPGGDPSIILNARERAAAVAELLRRGLSRAAIARRLGMHERSITRIVARGRAAAA